MIPILFLDIDDVVCLNERYGGFDVVRALNERVPQYVDVLRQVFNRDACALLRRLHESLDGRLSYVISSTWREAFTRSQLQFVFREGGLDFVAESLHEEWCTPIELEPGSREADITMWLALNHIGESFAILDDTSSGISLRPALKDASHEFFGRVVLCQEGVGLRPEHLETLRLALTRRIPGPERQRGDTGESQ